MDDLMNKHNDDWGILKLQNCILNIAKYIHDLCEQHNIQYCLMGGSALGAIRHKGFIPWDDDLDIFMTPDDYEKFRNVHSNDSGFYLQEWGEKDGMVSMAKIRLDRSSYVESDLADWDIHQGVYVDIFILHTCPDNKWKRYWQFVWAKYLVTKGAANRKYNRKGGIIGFIVKAVSLFPKRFLLGYALRQVYRYRNDTTEYLCHFMGRAMLKTGLYKRLYFDNTKKVEFERIELRVPGRCEDYLHDRWGDYMQLPSLEEIKKFQHCWRWSDSDYFSGYKENRDYKDEKYLLA